MSSTPTFTMRPKPWLTCLDIENQDGDHYFDYVNEALHRGIEGTPRRVLELGCATGMFGKTLKDRHPGVHVTGIEVGRAAAAKAATRIDRVVCSRIEDVDYAAEGFQPGEFDLVVAGDVLEHLVNPWDALTRVRPFMAPGGRLVVSIPNSRNLLVSAALLADGRFQYQERGLLDITHLRFFTFDEIRVMLESTGYAVHSFLVTLSPPLQEIFREHQGKPSFDLKLGRLTLTGVSQRELTEFCAEQFIVRATLAA